MTSNGPNLLILKIIMLGALVAALVYLFHPGVAQFTLLVNGAPVDDPFFHVAAIPASILVLIMIGILAFLALLGVGMMMLIVSTSIALMGILLIAPYFWPMLLIIAVIVLIMSSGKHKPE